MTNTFAKIFFIFCLFLFSYKNEKQEIINENPEKVLDSPEILIAQKGVEDTIVNIKFQEFTMSINHISIDDYQSEEFDKIQEEDTIFLSVWVSIERQKISMSSNTMTDFIVEQCSQTSLMITIDEETYYELPYWQHYSAWEELGTNDLDEFIVDDYFEEESSNFPKVNMKELKAKVKADYGEKAYKLIAKMNKIEFPIDFVMSGVLLRIKAKHKSSGKTVTKIIVITEKLGC